MSDIQVRIAELIESGWTYSALADELDVHRTSIYDWESGKHSPAHAKIVLRFLETLLQRQPPKKRRYKEGHYLQRNKASKRRLAVDPPGVRITQAGRNNAGAQDRQGHAAATLGQSSYQRAAAAA